MAENPDSFDFHFIVSNTGTLEDLRETTRSMIDFVLNVRDAVTKESNEIMDSTVQEG